jgi:hypothetical protein
MVPRRTTGIGLRSGRNAFRPAAHGGHRPLRGKVGLMTASTYTDPASPDTRPSARGLVTATAVRNSVRLLVAGAVVALIGAGWPLHVGATLVFGVAVLLYALGSMAREAPVDRG